MSSTKSWMRINFGHIFLVCITLILLAGCNSAPKPRQDNLALDLQNVFRENQFGIIHIGAIKAELEGIIQDSLISGTDDESKYFGAVNSKLKYDLFLVYDENRLFEITVDFKPVDDEYCGEVFVILKDILDSKYGFNPGDNGYSTWQAYSRDEKLIEISLIDESEEYQQPFITLNYFEHYDNGYGD